MIGYFNPYSKTNNPEEKNKRKVVGAGVTFLWATGLIIFALIPAVQSAFVAMNKIQTARDINSQLDTNLIKIASAKKLFEKEKDNSSLIDSAVPDNPHMVSFVNELDLAVAAEGLVLEGLDYEANKKTTAQPTPAANRPNTNKSLVTNDVEFTLKARGNYSQIRTLMDRLENLPRISEITTFNIGFVGEKETNQSDGSDSGIDVATTPLRITIIGKVHYKP